jgi:hypothetical protein
MSMRADGAVRLDEVREHGVRQHGQVAEEIVEGSGSTR